MRGAIAAAMALALVFAPGCQRKPASWKEWMDEAPATWKAQRFGETFEHCRKAMDYALEEKSGPRAVASLECMAEAATREGKVAKALPAFELVLRDYDADLRTSGAALRLRNNFAVAMVDEGRKQDGVDLFDSTLDAYEGTPQSSRTDYRVRMLLAANLARGVRVFPDSDASIRVSTEILDEIDNHLVTERFRKNPVATLGTAEAMAAIAELIRLRGDPRAANELAAKAREQLAIEDDVLEGQMRRIPCVNINIRSLVLRPCYASLR